MATEILRLAAEECTYNNQGRCTRTRSQQDSLESRCDLLESRRRLGLQALEGLDKLQFLSDEDDREVARRHLLYKNSKALEEINCPDCLPSLKEGLLCRHQFLVYCLKRLPICAGRCEDYLRQSQAIKDKPCQPA